MTQREIRMVDNIPADIAGGGGGEVGVKKTTAKSPTQILHSPYAMTRSLSQLN